MTTCRPTSDINDVPTSLFLRRLFYKYKNLSTNDKTYKDRNRQVVLFIHRMWIDQTMCDVKINCCDGNVMTHQVVLSAYSTTLASLFSQHQIQHTVTINLRRIRKKVAVEVLNFLYTTDLRLNCLVLEEVILCAKQLDLPIVLDVCNDYLIQTADPSNIILHYSVASNSDLIETKDRLLSVLAKSFNEIHSHPHFPMLPRDRLLEIFHHNLNKATEEELFIALMRWVEYNKEERLPSASQLLSSIDMQNIKPSKMAILFDQYSWIMTEETCKDLAIHLFRHHALVGVRNKRPDVDEDNKEIGCDEEVLESYPKSPNNKLAKVRFEEMKRAMALDASQLAGSYHKKPCSQTTSQTVSTLNESCAQDETGEETPCRTWASLTTLSSVSCNPSRFDITTISDSVFSKREENESVLYKDNETESHTGCQNVDVDYPLISHQPFITGQNLKCKNIPQNYLAEDEKVDPYPCD